MTAVLMPPCRLDTTVCVNLTRFLPTGRAIVARAAFSPAPRGARPRSVAGHRCGPERPDTDRRTCSRARGTCRGQADAGATRRVHSSCARRRKRHGQADDCDGLPVVCQRALPWLGAEQPEYRQGSDRLVRHRHSPASVVARPGPVHRGLVREQFWARTPCSRGGSEIALDAHHVQGRRTSEPPVGGRPHERRSCGLFGWLRHGAGHQVRHPAVACQSQRCGDQVAGPSQTRLERPSLRGDRRLARRQGLCC